MGCSSPLKAWPVGLTENGKTAYKITSLNVIDVKDKIGDPIQVPCGKCVGCRLKYSREWADRCLLEAKYHPFNWFLTLTYDDDHVPTTVLFGDEDRSDDLVFHLSLKKRDLQLFFKRLREEFGYESFRYYACGEYGDETFRPHYHVLLFSQISEVDLEPEPIRYLRGNWLYKSDRLASVWQNGMVGLAPMTWETAAYTARYCMKKLGGAAADDYKVFGIEPEFCVMSRRPGIGYHYYEDHKDEIYRHCSFSVATEKGGHKLRPSRYYDRLYDLECPDIMHDIRLARRSSAENSLRLKLSRTDLSYEDYLRVEEQTINDRLKKLIRSDF